MLDIWQQISPFQFTSKISNKVLCREYWLVYSTYLLVIYGTKVPSCVLLSAELFTVFFIINRWWRSVGHKFCQWRRKHINLRCVRRRFRYMQPNILERVTNSRISVLTIRHGCWKYSGFTLEHFIKTSSREQREYNFTVNCVWCENKKRCGSM